jgi:cytoskeletal protein CcmA (bactofilin family)
LFKGDSGNKKINTETYDIMVGPHTTIDGNISSEGSVRIEGIINGSIDSKGNIIVGPKANITGNVTCLSIEISGSVKGNISARGNTQVFATGSLIGDIDVISFNIEEGAVFDGNCKISKKQPIISDKKEK